MQLHPEIASHWVSVEKGLPIEKDKDSHPEIHYTRIYRMFTQWIVRGCFDAIFVGSARQLHQNRLLDTSVVNGDGSTTASKKGGDNIGFNAHKKMRGDKVVAFCDRNCNVIRPFIPAPGNQNESPLSRDALPLVMRIATATGIALQGAIVSLDGVYDSRANRKAIFNRGMTPNINENPRNRKTSKRGRKSLFDPAIFKERFNTIERVFAWEINFGTSSFDLIASQHNSVPLLHRVPLWASEPFPLLTKKKTMITLKYTFSELNKHSGKSISMHIWNWKLIGKEESHGNHTDCHLDPHVRWRSSHLAPQQELGILSQRRTRINPSDFDHLAATWKDLKIL